MVCKGLQSANAGLTGGNAGRGQREERIRRNREMLLQLGMPQAAGAGSSAAQRGGAPANPGADPGADPGAACSRPAKRRPAPDALEPTRRSARARGGEPETSEGGEGADTGAADAPGAPESVPVTGRRSVWGMEQAAA